MPETSGMGPAMDKAAQEATESFSKGTEKLGDKVTENISKSKDKIKDVFRRTGSDASDAMADSINQNSKKVEDAVAQTGDKAKGKFRESLKDVGKEFVNSIGPDVKRQLTDRVEDVVGGAFKTVLGDSGIGGIIGDTVSKAASQGVGSWLDGLKDKVNGVKETAKDTKAAFADLTGGKTATGIAGLVDNFGKLEKHAKDFGVDIGNLPEPVQHVVDQTTDLKNTAHDFADVFAGMPGKIGAMSAAFGEFLDGPFALVVAGAMAIKEAYDWGVSHVDANMNRNTPFLPNMPTVPQGIPGAGQPVPGSVKSTPGIPMPKLTTDQRAALQYMGIDPDHAAPAEIYKALHIPLPAQPEPSMPTGGWFGGGGHPATRGFNFPSSGRHIGSDQGLTSTSKSVKQVVADLFPQITDIGGWRPPDGYNEHSSGQALDVMIPGWNTPQGKALGDQISQYVLSHSKELGVDYTIWQHGQHNPDGSFQMYGDRGSPTQNHMDHVHIHTTKGDVSPSDLVAAGLPGNLSAGLGSRSMSGKSSPLGSKDDPLFTTAVSQDGSTDDPSQKFGSGFLDGIAQSLGLDGSVFKGFGGASNPKDFGITKLGMGLLNWGMGQQHSMPGARGSIPQGPGGAQNVRTDQTGDTHNYYGPVSTGMNVTQNGVTSPTGSLNDMNNSSRTGTATMPNAGTLPSA